MKLAVSNKTTLKKLDSYGVNVNDPLKEMQAMQVKAISNPHIAKQNDGTFKIVLHNIDFRSFPVNKAKNNSILAPIYLSEL